MKINKHYNEQSIDVIFIQSHAGEVKSGRLLKWLHKFKQLTPGDIPVRIFLDVSSAGVSQVNELTSMITDRDIEIVFVDDTVGSNPTSVVWVEMMNYCTSVWRKALLLETDCLVEPGYLTAINADMSRFNDWWVYGSIYCGDSSGHFDELNRITHMNGVAVYNRTAEFIDFVNHVFYTMAGIDSAVNFDWYLAKFIHSNGDIYHRFIDSKHIINISPEWDTHVNHTTLKPLAKIIHCKKYVESTSPVKFEIKHTPIANDSETNNIILYTTLYNELNKERFDELKYCLDTNLQNKNISEIVVFTENSPSTMGKYSDKIKVVPTPTRPTYHDMLKHANQHNPGHVIIIANSDIYFDTTLNKIKEQNMTDKFFSLTRWCVHANGQSYLPHVRNSSYPIDSINHQDMISLRWWNAPMIKNNAYERNYDKYQEQWMLQHDDIKHVYDMQYFDQQLNVKGKHRSSGSSACWRNELSADAWVFQAPYAYLDDRYKIPIGTFRCDTWLNYLLIQEHNKDNIELSNPCLSIKTHHHDFLRTDSDKNYDSTGDTAPEWLDNIIQDSSRDTIVHSCYVPWVSIQHD